MQNSTALKFLPVFSDEKRVEVNIVDGQTVIKLSTWEEGLGWCGQKTMSLDAEMLDELHRVIAAARVRLHNANAEDEGQRVPSKVLDFPHIS
jgi:hypothetical protein